MTAMVNEILNGKTPDAKSLEKIALELEIIAANFRRMAEMMSPEKEAAKKQLSCCSGN